MSRFCLVWFCKIIWACLLLMLNIFSWIFNWRKVTIQEDELVVLYGLCISESLDFLYWNYLKFDIDSQIDYECKSDLEFYELAIVLNTQEKKYPTVKIWCSWIILLFLKPFVYLCSFSYFSLHLRWPVLELI